MSSSSSAARTNLTSQRVQLHKRDRVGEGAFRMAYGGTYIGGNRNQQEAVCKCFKSKYKPLETEFFRTDFRVADRAISFAEDWNGFCEYGKEILVTKGDVMTFDGTKFLVEPLIRYFMKFTSNNGWIANVDNYAWQVEAMEAFCHFTYHRSGGQMIVCDLQGRYRFNRFDARKSRFELTDPAICSRNRNYGPTDLGEKGIETFFANHVCNRFCHSNGARWSSPRCPTRWFSASHNTSMLRESATNLLQTQNRAKFSSNLQPIYDYDSNEESSEDEYLPMKVSF